MPPAVADAADPQILPTVEPGGAVHFEHVGFGYDNGVAVLDDFDLLIEAGTSVAIVGATGSGKSTLARLLIRFYDVQQGAIRVDGVDVRDLRLGDLRRAVSIVFEDTFLFSDTVGANIGFARSDASPEEIGEAAQLAGAHEFVSSLPEGYDTVLG